MKTEYQYIYIRFVQKVSALGITSIWNCLNAKSGGQIGKVAWYSPWRSYCFFPCPDTVYSAGCLADIQDFIGQLMRERSQSKVS